MSSTAIKNLALGVLCAGLVGAAGMASAADRYFHGYGHRVYGHGYAPRVGLGIGVVIGAPIYAEPAYVDPYYVAPVYAPTVVIGGGGYYGRHYYGGPRFYGGYGYRGGLGYRGGFGHRYR